MNIWLYWENKPGKTTPPYIELCRQAAIKHSKGHFDVVLVTPETLNDFLPELRKDLNDIRRVGDDPNKVNIPIKTAYIRVALLEKYGGVWLDSDMVLIKSFKPVLDLLEEYNFVGYKHWFGYVVNNFLASKPAGNVIKEYKIKLDNLFDSNKVLPWGLAGAKTISPIVFADDNTYLFEKRSFHPIHYEQRQLFFKTKLDVKSFIDNSTLCFALFNDLFPESFKDKSKEEILEGNTLISKILIHALED